MVDLRLRSGLRVMFVSHIQSPPLTYPAATAGLCSLRNAHGKSSDHEIPRDPNQKEGIPRESPSRESHGNYHDIPPYTTEIPTGIHGRGNPHDNPLNSTEIPQEFPQKTMGLHDWDSHLYGQRVRWKLLCKFLAWRRVF